MKNQFLINKELVKSWAKEYYINGIYDVIILILYALSFFVGIALIVLAIQQSNYSKLILPIAIIALAVYRLFFYRFQVWSARYKTMSTTYGVSEWLRTTEFTDEEIILTDHNSITKLQYNNIVKIKEKDNKISIIFNNSILLRLYKDTFVDCTWDECKRFINSKTQK